MLRNSTYPIGMDNSRKMSIGMFSVLLCMSLFAGAYLEGSITQFNIIQTTEQTILNVYNGINYLIIQATTTLNRQTAGLASIEDTMYGGIAIAVLIVITYFIINQTKILYAGDTSHTAPLTGAGGSLLSLLIPIVIAIGVLLTILGLYRVAKARKI